MPVYPQQPPALLRCCLRRPRAVRPGRSPRRTATVIHQGSPSALQRLAGYESAVPATSCGPGRPSHSLPGQVAWRLPVGWDGNSAGQSRGRDCRVAGTSQMNATCERLAGTLRRELTGADPRRRTSARRPGRVSGAQSSPTNPPPRGGIASRPLSRLGRSRRPAELPADSASAASGEEAQPPRWLAQLVSRASQRAGLRGGLWVGSAAWPLQPRPAVGTRARAPGGGSGGTVGQ